MIASILADAVLVVHLLFIAYVVAGAALLWRWPRSAWLHLPAAAWGAYAAASGAICPLTPLENALRRAAGEQGYAGGFIEHYLLPLIYPAGLTPAIQALLGATVVAINGVAYAAWLRRRRRRGPSSR
jgi:hypothetical protein